MKKKIGTMLDEDLIFRAKQAALSERQALNQLLENALRMYLDSLEKKKNAGRNGVSEMTRGAMSISPAALKAIMEEEGVYETH
ncbi:MAG: hypothetical protein DRH37_11670 [Deltaproteobacteria bacterium]|nr:MAG: hypothetical protein DRH37_11670 [Deltaproteobacteria bacterium]